MNRIIFTDIREVVCDHVHDRFGESAWRFFDPRLIAVMNYIRSKMGKELTYNSRSRGLSQRGLRCNLCSLVQDKTKLNRPYLSAHVLGAAIDFDAKDMTAEEVRAWIYLNRSGLPYPVRLEQDTTWIHIDVATISDDKVTFFAG
jgi:hypothetical protein